MDALASSSERDGGIRLRVSLSVAAPSRAILGFGGDNPSVGLVGMAFPEKKNKAISHQQCIVGQRHVSHLEL